MYHLYKSVASFLLSGNVQSHRSRLETRTKEYIYSMYNSIRVKANDIKNIILQLGVLRANLQCSKIREN